jgi:hypothetical protein
MISYNAKIVCGVKIQNAIIINAHVQNYEKS